MRTPVLRLIAVALLLTFAADTRAASAQERANPERSLCSVTVPVPPPPGRGGGAGAPAGGRRGAAPVIPAQPPRLVRITDDLYVVQNVNHTLAELGYFGGNSAIYLTNDGVVLVDSKSDREHDDLVGKIRSVSDKPVKYVVLTHNHGDHTGGAAKLQEKGATIVMSDDDREHLARAGQPMLVQLTYSGHGAIYLGGKEIRLTQYCGHTRGDTVVSFPGARAIAVGDLVAWPESIPQIVNYPDGGSWTDTLRTLDALVALDWEFLIPGHGPVMTKQEFQGHKTRFGAVVARARDLIKQGRSQEEVGATLQREFNWAPAGNLPGLMAEFR